MIDSFLKEKDYRIQWTISNELSIIGNLNGQYTDLLRHFEHSGFPPNSKYLFLGNYVDRGRQSLETICLLLAYKVC